MGITKRTLARTHWRAQANKTSHFQSSRSAITSVNIPNIRAQNWSQSGAPNYGPPNTKRTGEEQKQGPQSGPEKRTAKMKSSAVIQRKLLELCTAILQETNADILHNKTVQIGRTAKPRTVSVHPLFGDLRAARRPSKETRDMDLKPK